MIMFDRYSRGGKSLQVLSKGLYWAGKAALVRRRAFEATAYFQRSSRLSRTLLRPARARAARPVDSCSGAAPDVCGDHAAARRIRKRRLVQAIQILGQQGQREEQTLFVRALAESLNSDSERVLATQFGQQIGRAGLGVWVARMARIKGNAFYVSPAYPRLQVSLPAHACGRWLMGSPVRRAPSTAPPSAMPARGV